MTIYVLEYNKEQNAYHIHPIAERRKILPEINAQWAIVRQGTYDFVSKEYELLHAKRSEKVG